MKLKEFFIGAWEELSKVTWPVKKGKNFTLYEKFEELIEATMVVIIATGIFSVVIYVFDYVITEGISRFVLKVH